MDVGKLSVDYRGTVGTNEARRLRAAGRVPGICYGPGQQPVPIALDPKALIGALDPEKRQNTVITLTVNGGQESGRQLTVMLKDTQINILRGGVTHVDFIAIDVNKEVTVEVPMVLTGKPIGIVDGGMLTTAMRLLPVTCKPQDIPVKIEVDISDLDIGDARHVGDVKLPAGVVAAADPGETIASIVAPKAEKTAAEEAAEAAEAAVATGAAPAEGAAPAAGAAAAAPAAGAPAAGKKEEKK